MLKLRHLLLLLALCASPFSYAMKGIFWQPQLRDSSVSAEQWSSLMQTLREEGFDTLILQWTRYGEAFSNRESQIKLQQRADAARAAGLKIIVGLHADPDFFQRQKQPAAALGHYLSRLRVADIHQAKTWTSRADGWYLSAEIDDLNWRNQDNRARLLAWLKDTRQQLVALDNKPIFISSFFAGNMAPEGYQRLISDMRTTGINVWIQDGTGVKTLTPTERERYLNASAGCSGSTPASGVVYELFRVQPGKTFRAAPLPDNERARQLARHSSCSKDRLYFSLRYLPAAQTILSWQ